MAGPINFLKGLVGASPSQSPESVKSEKVGRYNHRTAEALDGKPILRKSKEYYIAEANKLKKQAGEYRSRYAKDNALQRAQEAENHAKSAKTNAELHAKLDAELEQDIRLAESRRKKHTVPLDQIKSKQAKDAGGRPILEGSREQIMAEAKRCEERAAKCVTQMEKDVELMKARSLKIDARNAKTNAELHIENKLEEAEKQMAEMGRKRYRSPLDQIKKAMGKAVDPVKHEAEDFLNDLSQAKRLHDRKINISNEEGVLKNLIKQRDTLKWYKNPKESFNLWRDIGTKEATIAALKKENHQHGMRS